MAFINTGRHVASSSGFRLIGGDDVQEYSEGGVNYRAHTWLNTGSVTATADVTLAKKFIMSDVQALTCAAGANNVTVTETFTRLTLPGSGTCTLTLPAGTAGQVKTIFTAVAGGATVTLTTTNVLPAVTTTLQEVGDSWTGWYDTTASKWQTISTVAAGVSS